MASWNFDLTVVSASDLQAVRIFRRMKVYTQVSVTERPDSVRNTPVDYDGETNPCWAAGISRPRSPSPTEPSREDDVVLIKLLCGRTSRSVVKYVVLIKIGCPGHMGGWNFDLTIVSAANLPDVRNWGRMKVYADVSVTGKPDFAWRTPVDYDGETNPQWNVKTPFVLSEEALQAEEDVVLIKLFCERSFGDPRYVGEVKLSLKSLFNNRHARLEFEEYKVIRVDENGSFGLLKISHRFHEITGETSKASSQDEGSSESEGREKLMGGASAFVEFVVKETVVAVAESFIPGSSTIIEELSGE